MLGYCISSAYVMEQSLHRTMRQTSQLLQTAPHRANSVMATSSCEVVSDVAVTFEYSRVQSVSLLFRWIVSRARSLVLQK